VRVRIAPIRGAAGRGEETLLAEWPQGEAAPTTEAQSIMRRSSPRNVRLDRLEPGDCWRTHTCGCLPSSLQYAGCGGPAVAQNWQEYSYPDYSFRVVFPADPQIEITTYRVADDRSVEAQGFGDDSFVAYEVWMVVRIRVKMHRAVRAKTAPPRRAAPQPRYAQLPPRFPAARGAT
jgi:hypothetical protein